MPEDKLTVTLSELGEAFSEWDRRYCEERERFHREINALLERRSEPYGKVCARYLLQIVKENSTQRKARI